MNYGRQCKLEWLTLKKDKENAGELLACFELFLMDEKANNKYIPNYPPKVGALYTVPSGIRPELQRTMIEVLFIRDVKIYASIFSDEYWLIDIFLLLMEL
jgi:hypothetical protein